MECGHCEYARTCSPGRPAPPLHRPPLPFLPVNERETAVRLCALHAPAHSTTPPLSRLCAPAHPNTSVCTVSHRAWPSQTAQAFNTPHLDPPTGSIPNLQHRLQPIAARQVHKVVQKDLEIGSAPSQEDISHSTLARCHSSEEQRSGSAHCVAEPMLCIAELAWALRARSAREAPWPQS